MRAATSVCILLLAAAGCKKPAGQGSLNATATYTQIDWNTAGTISGTIHISGEMPKSVQIDMAQDPACNFAAANFSEQYVGRNGSLQNVFIYVKDGLGNRMYPAPSTAVIIDQKGCRYHPHVLGVVAGQAIEIDNSDPTTHNIHPTPDTASGNREFNQSQGPGAAPISANFSRPETMLPVKCNQHPWMKMYINVSKTPYFAVTKDDGKFEIKDLPPGTYNVVAVHEKLGKKNTSVTVTAKQAATADFSFGGQ